MTRARKKSSDRVKRDPPKPPDTAGDTPDAVEQASEDSFPASDPPAWEPLHPGEPASRSAKVEIEATAVLPS